jgi:hypothetical protein
VPSKSQALEQHVQYSIARSSVNAACIHTHTHTHTLSLSCTHTHTITVTQRQREVYSTDNTRAIHTHTHTHTHTHHVHIHTTHLGAETSDQRASGAEEDQHHEQVEEHDEHQPEEEGVAGGHLSVVELGTVGIVEQSVAPTNGAHVRVRERERIGPHLDAAVVRETRLVLVM